MIRPQNNSWNFSGTICLTLALTLIHMELILSGVVVANTSHQSADGLSAVFVSGEDGAQSSHT